MQTATARCITSSRSSRRVDGFCSAFTFTHPLFILARWNKEHVQGLGHFIVCVSVGVGLPVLLFEGVKFWLASGNPYPSYASDWYRQSYGQLHRDLE